MQEVFKKIIDKLKAEQNKADEKCKDIVVMDGHSLEYEFYNGKSIECKHAIEIVKQVAVQYNNGWIPCSERLPSDCSIHEVTAQFRNGKVYTEFAYYDEAKEEWWKHDNDGLVNVIAWREESAPYQPKGEL